jgi:transmembrane sensor
MRIKDDKQSADILISGYLNGELTAAETRELIDWIRIDKANKKYFDEFCEIWVTVRASQKSSGYNVQSGFWKFRQKIRRDRTISARPGKAEFLRITRYAAVFIIAFSLSGLLFYYTGKNHASVPRQSLNELTVPLGSNARITLIDGSVVTLNAGSKLKFDDLFGVEERVVYLEGEGYFNVSKDDNKPFIVKTPFLNVTALGTEFNVKAYALDRTIEATLVNGSIQIEPVTENSHGEITVLKPNQKLTFYKGNSMIIDETEAANPNSKHEIEPVKVNKPSVIPRLVKENVNVEPVVSWKENRWIFEQQSLEQIAIDLERKFDVQINFESERLKKYRFTGTIIAEPIEQVLELMSISAPISFKLKGRIVTLSENKYFEELNKSLYNRQKQKIEK